jgi:hypothetical protein
MVSTQATLALIVLVGTCLAVTPALSETLKYGLWVLDGGIILAL